LLVCLRCLSPARPPACQHERQQRQRLRRRSSRLCSHNRRTCGWRSILKRLLESPLGCRRVWVADVLAAPLWQAGSTAAAAAAASSHAQAGVSTSVTPASASSPALALAPASASAGATLSFAPASLRFGAPSFELAAAELRGKVTARLDEHDVTMAHFMLQDNIGGALRVAIPLALLFAALPLKAKLAARGNAKPGGGTTPIAASSCHALLASPASAWLPDVGDVLDVSGRIELCRTSNTRRLLVSAYQLLTPHDCAADEATAAARVEALLSERAQQIRQLYDSHFFRALHMPPPPPAVPTPQRTAAAAGGFRTPPTSPLRTPVTVATTSQGRQPVSPFSAQGSSSTHKRTGFGIAMQASPPRAVGSRLNFNTPQQQQQTTPLQHQAHTTPLQRAPPLPLPLPPVASSPGRPRSYLEELCPRRRSART